MMQDCKTAKLKEHSYSIISASFIKLLCCVVLLKYEQHLESYKCESDLVGREDCPFQLIGHSSLIL